MSYIDNIAKVKTKNYLRLLGFPNTYKPDENILEMIDWVENWYDRNGSPWVEQFDVTILIDEKDYFFANDIKIESPELFKRFSEAKVDRAIMLVASAGKELEEEAQKYWKQGIPDKYYFLEIYGSAMVEELISLNTRKICSNSETEGYRVLDRYSPGYYGWDITGQHDLFSIISKSDKSITENKLKILESGMLWPKKSQISLNGLSKFINKSKGNQLPCINCFYDNCDFRRAPYKLKEISI